MSRFINPITQYIDANGAPLAGGSLEIYRFNTDTLITIYSDEGETASIANPVSLGDRGEVPNIFFSEAARAVIRDSLGTVVFDVQPVVVAGSGSAGGIGPWQVNTSYDRLSMVYGSDENYYVSISDDNAGNDPTDTTDDSANWTRWEVLKRWNDQETYSGNDIVLRGNNFYLSQADANTGNDPATDSVNWIDLTNALLSPYDNTISGLAATNVKTAIDELQTNIDAVPSASTYRGQLDVSSGNAALPVGPTNGDFYNISTGGTITVSSNGGTPAATAVTAGQAIIYNGGDTQWDLIASVEDAAAVDYDNTTSGLAGTNVQTAIDEVEARVQVNEGDITTLESQVAALGTGSNYQGQLDVSTGDAALPSSPDAGDLYYISVAGTITVSVSGASPAATAVSAGDAILYNDSLSQWDLLVGAGSAVIDEAADYDWTGTHTFADGLLSTDIDLTDDFNFTGNLQRDGFDVYTTDTIDEAVLGINEETGTSYTPVIGDRNGIIEMNNASANTVTIPPNSSVAYPVGTTLSITQTGAGQTSIAQGAGVTINTPVGYNINAQDGRAILYKRATDVWQMNGDLQA